MRLMNLRMLVEMPLTPSLSPSDGERDGVRGIRLSLKVNLNKR
jgi:hypothetical protein